MGKGLLFSHTYRYIDRYRKILSILAKYGFYDFLSKVNAYKYLPTKDKPQKRVEKRLYALSRWERLRLALEELGPTFIKFGQIMSNRPDLLPEKLVDQLEKLQDEVPPFDGKIARKIVEKDLQNPIGELFRSFDEKPFASASIAQVHKAVLFNGEEVVLKIQRPKIKETISIDIDIMHDLAVLVEKYLPVAEIVDPVGLVDLFERLIQKELNFNTEAAHIEKFYHNFQGNPHIKVPKLYKEFSTAQIITMEYVEGIKISKTEELVKAGLDLKMIAKRGFNLYLEQVFEHGFFHADPHPGNLIVQKRNVLCFLDFGMMGYIMPQDLDMLNSIIIGIEERDIHRIVKTIEMITGNRKIENFRELEYELNAMLNEYYHFSLEEISVQELLSQFTGIVLKHKLKFPSDFFLLLKSMVIIEGVGRKLDPGFNALKHLKPFVVKLEMKRLNPLNSMKRVMHSALDFGNLLRELPYDVKDVIDSLKDGKVNVDLERKGIQPIIKTFDKVSNRISFAIVLAALIIGSSLIVLSGVSPTWNGIPLIGMGGFIIAALMALWLLISIFRHGKI